MMISHKHKYPKVFSTLSTDQELHFHKGEVWTTSHNMADEHTGDGGSHTVKDNQTYRHNKQCITSDTSNYQCSNVKTEDLNSQRNAQISSVPAKKPKIVDKSLEKPPKSTKPKQVSKPSNSQYCTRYGRKVRLPSRYIE